MSASAQILRDFRGKGHQRSLQNVGENQIVRRRRLEVRMVKSGSLDTTDGPGHAVGLQVGLGYVDGDLINVAGLGIQNFNQILAITSDIGGRAVIQFNGNVDLVRLEGVETAQLSAEDFIFSGGGVISNSA